MGTMYSSNRQITVCLCLCFVFRIGLGVSVSGHFPTANIPIMLTCRAYLAESSPKRKRQNTRSPNAANPFGSFLKITINKFSAVM